jgi:hypothetical protein
VRAGCSGKTAARCRECWLAAACLGPRGQYRHADRSKVTTEQNAIRRQQQTAAIEAEIERQIEAVRARRRRAA